MSALIRSGVALALALLVFVPAGSWPGANVPRIGVLCSFSPADAAAWIAAFRQSMRELGWVEGTNIAIEYRYAQGKADRLPQLAVDLVQLKVDVIVASITPAAMAARMQPVPSRS